MDWSEIIMVILAAVVPPIVYAIWIRNTERCGREKYRSIAGAFVLGASVSVLGAILLETFAIEIIYTPGSIFAEGFWNFAPYDPNLQIVILAVIVAPFVEEYTKSWGVMIFRRRLVELEDGLVYGAAAGLGFAALENVLYETSALASGFDVFVATAVVRALSSTLLHATASAIVGYGIARKVILGARGRRVSWLPYYLLAVLLHGSFNALAVMGEVVDSIELPLIGLILAFIMVFFLFGWVRERIKELDSYSCE